MGVKGKIPKNLDIEEVVEKDQRDKSTTDNMRIDFLERIQNYERKCKELRKNAEKKTERREERLNAEIAELKRRDIYLAAAEKLTKKDEGR